MAKILTIKKLEKKLQRYMYPLIKERDGNVCISCGKRGLAKQTWHAGHYIKAETCNLIYRYDERNINSQCSYCNQWLAGNTIAYRQSVIAKYGADVVRELEEEYKMPLPTTFNSRAFLEGLIEFYKDNKRLKN